MDSHTNTMGDSAQVLEVEHKKGFKVTRLYIEDCTAPVLRIKWAQRSFFIILAPENRKEKY
jgi:hypothetical protein